MSSADTHYSAPWMGGNIGVLKSGRVLTVTLKRDENTFYVNADYGMIHEEAIEIFESFLGLRMKYLKHKYAHTPVVPTIEDDPEFHMVSREDVHRVAMFICDPHVVNAQTEQFIQTFFTNGKERLNQAEFLKVLTLECDRRKLTKWECFFLLFEDPSSSTLSYVVAVAIMILIVVSSLCFVLSTDPSFQVESNDPDLPPEPHSSFVVIEKICIYCFLVEYLCRVLVVWAVRKGVVGSGTQKFTIMECFPSPYSSNTNNNTSSSSSSSPHRQSSSHKTSQQIPIKKRQSLSSHVEDIEISSWNRWWRGIGRTSTYVVNPMNLIDLIAILPFFISQLLGGEGGNLSSLRILRLARVMRIFKLAKKNEGINMLSTTMAMSRGSLNLLVFFGVIGTVVFGSLIYFTESGEWHTPEDCAKALPDFEGCSDGMFLRPDKFGIGKELTPFSSIPRTFWWVVVTATTVGYGDMYPTTALGKLVATFAMVSGLLVLALPISIIGTNFLVCYEKLDERNRRARILEELEEKMKKEEKEAAVEAAMSLKTKQRDALEKMPWRKKAGLRLSGRTKTSSASGGVFSFKPKPKKFSAAVVAASWSVSGSPKMPHKSIEQMNDSSPSTTSAMTTATTPTGSIDKGINALVRGVKLNSKGMVAHKLKVRMATQKKSMVDGHHSLVGLKAKARLIPSFLFDTNIILNPPANLNFISVDRKANVFALSLAGFGKSHHRKSNHMSDVALAVKYKPLLDKAQNVLECIQALHTRGKVDDPTVLNVAREIVDLTRKIILLQEREFHPLKSIGLEVDAAVLVVLAWLGRDADCFFKGGEDFEIDGTIDEDDEEGKRESFKLEAEDERRIRLNLFEYTVTALEVAKKQLTSYAAGQGDENKASSDSFKQTHQDNQESIRPPELEMENKAHFTMSKEVSSDTDHAGTAHSLKRGMTGNVVSSIEGGDASTLPQFGEGSFQVKLDKNGLNFTLISSMHDSITEEEVDIHHHEAEIIEKSETHSPLVSSTGSSRIEWWWTRWFM